MKIIQSSRLILIIHIILISSFVQGQNYTPFDLKNGEWVCVYDTKGGVFSNYTNHYIKEEVKFYCEGDTIINDELYNKLYYKGVASYPEWAKRELSGYYGPIRNDTINKQVWFGNRILYDFNLQIGDSIKSDWEYGGPILSIDSVLYCDKYHRRYNYKCEYSDSMFLIEGIGSIYGLFPRTLMPSISYLSCYAEANNPTCDTCGTPTSVNEIVIEDVEVFPNPTDDEIKVISGHPISSIEILDLFGRQVFFNSQINENKISVRLRDKGLYIVRLEISGRVIIRKVVKN